MYPRIDLLKISSIAEHPEPVLRNLQITQTYSEINLALSELLGKTNVSWCAYATWASKTAGKFIRLENVDAAIDEFMRGKDWAQELLGVIPGAMSWFGWKVKINNSFLLKIINETARASATEVAKVNLLVFAELAPLYAQFLQLITVDADQREKNLEAFLSYLQQNQIEDDSYQKLVKAYSAYQEAIFETDPMATDWRKIATKILMRIEVPDGHLDLSDDIPMIAYEPVKMFPEELIEIRNPALLQVLTDLDRSPNSSTGSAAKDWGDLGERMNFIADFFRSAQQDTHLFWPPFNAQQTELIKQGKVPSGKL